MSSDPDLSRLGFVGIVIDAREQAAPAVNDLLSRHGDLILGRIGLPRGPGQAVITLVVEATNDELGRLTGQLGQIPSVQVRSALAR